MIDALSLAASSMSNDVSRLATIGQNLANATTPAYKREISLATPFMQAMESAERYDAAGLGTGPTSVVDHRAGTLRFTGTPLDFALEGEGFFEVQTESGVAYTRQGDFQLDAMGRLVTQAGHVVQGVGGPLHLPSANATVDREGRVFDGEKPVGQLKLVRFADPGRLVRLGNGLFQSAESPAEPLDASTRVRQGHLEASNVNTAAEMVKLVETMRHFEATQKVVQGVDEMMERALRKLGEF